MAVTTKRLDILTAAADGGRLAPLPWDFGPASTTDHNLTSGPHNLANMGALVGRVRRVRGRTFTLSGTAHLDLGTATRIAIIECTDSITIDSVLRGRGQTAASKAVATLGGRKSDPGFWYLLTGDISKLAPAEYGGANIRPGGTLVLKAPLITIGASADLDFALVSAGSSAGSAGGKVMMIGNRIVFPSSGTVLDAKGGVTNSNPNSDHSGDDGDLVVVYRDALVGDVPARVQNVGVTLLRVGRHPRGARR